MKKGYLGQRGGAFIPEVLHATFVELNAEYVKARQRYICGHFPEDFARACRYQMTEGR